MSFFKRHSPSNVDLKGFLVRTQGASITGILYKYVKNDRKNSNKPKPFFILEYKAGECLVHSEDDVELHTPVEGDYVGVSANWSLKSQLDEVKDIGKLVRLTVVGFATNPNGGKDMTIFTVEVDEPDDADAAAIEKDA